MLVDLNTHDAELEALILEEYGSKENESRKEEDKIRLFPEQQHGVDKTTEPRMFCFYDLNPVALARLLEGREDMYDYEVRESGTGKFLPKDLSNYLKTIKNL